VDDVGLFIVKGYVSNLWPEGGNSW
jgi:hypothetical protein